MELLTLEQVCKQCGEPLQAQSPSVSSYSISHPSTSVTQDPPGNAVYTGLTALRMQDVLRLLLTLQAQASTLDTFLPAFSSFVQQVTHADLCVILLPDMQGHLLEVRSCSPDLRERGVILQKVHIEQTLLARLHHDLLRERTPHLAVHEYALLNPLENVQFETLLAIPLFVNDECIGVINCYAQNSRDYTVDECLILATIAQQGAFMLKNAASMTFEKKDSRALVQAFIHDLLSSSANGGRAFLQRRARFLGYNLDAPHIVIALQCEQLMPGREIREQSRTGEEQHQIAYQRILALVQEIYPGSLLALCGSELICLLDVGNETAIEPICLWFKQHIQHLQEEQHVSLIAGISDLCTMVDRYPLAYSQAKEAQEIGPYLTEDGVCTVCAAFCSLGIYRYIYDFACAKRLPDQYEEQVALIQRYDDQHKSSCLLPTLETYLECGTNIADASRLLSIQY